MEHRLQVGLPHVPRPRLEEVDALGQVLRHGGIGEDLQVLGVEEGQAGLALDLPQLAIRVDDSVACWGMGA